MLAKWEQERREIAEYLLNMTSHLQAPFAQARLPDVRLPEEV
jgi:hypothetical protein